MGLLRLRPLPPPSPFSLSLAVSLFLPHYVSFPPFLLLMCTLVRARTHSRVKFLTVIPNSHTIQVPTKWSAAAYLSLKPLAGWIADLEIRVSFFRRWTLSGAPSAYLLPAFFFPQGFLTAALQRHARFYKLAIDTLAFDFHVLKQATGEDVAAPQDGVYVQGFWIEAARWDRRSKMLKTSLEGEMLVPLPLLHLLPSSASASAAVSHQRSNDRVEPKDVTAHPDAVASDVNCIYECPLYKTSARQGTVSTTGQSSNFVLFVLLPAQGQSDDWIRQGTCLLCQTND